MYKSCGNCKKLTRHKEKINNRNMKKTYICGTCGGTTKGLSSRQRAELEERRAEIYKEKTFDDVMNSVRQEMNRDASEDGL